MTLAIGLVGSHGRNPDESRKAAPELVVWS
jgi:hypothetical protein